MSKIELDNVLSGYNLSKINSNFQKIEDELNNKVMYRNPPVGEPNQLEQDVDANGKRIYNLASPTNRSEAVTLGFLEDRVGGTLEVTSWSVEAFTGDGVSSQFILTTEPASLESVFVSVDGLNYIPAVDFSILSGNILQFNEVPYNGANISVRYGTFLGGGSGLTTISNMPQSAGDNGLVANGTLGTIKNLKAGSNITLASEGERITISSTASGGETTAANKGSGTGVFDSKVGNELKFKSLVASGNITLSASADTITIGSASSVGEANTASNKGVGTGLFWNKVGTDLQFKSLSPAGTIQISSTDSSHVVIDCTARTTLANNFPVPGSVGVYGTRSGETLLFKPLIAGTGITIDDGLFDDRITISASGGGGTSLPNQSGNAGKYLKTDGSLVSWSNVFDIQSVNQQPSYTFKSLNNGEIVQDGILLTNDFNTVIDLRKTLTANTVGGLGGNANLYSQMQHTGSVNTTTSAIGLRSQVETSANQSNTGVVSDVVGVYGGVHQKGSVNMNAFGMHADVYHNPSGGTAGSSYGMAVEFLGNHNNSYGQTAGLSVRNYTSNSGSIGYGLFIGGNSSGKYKRGISLGSVAYSGVNGGMPNTTYTNFDVGVDLSQANYTNGTALKLKGGSHIAFSGSQGEMLNSPENLAACMKFNPTTGNLGFSNNGVEKFSVNMTTGDWYKNGVLTNPVSTITPGNITNYGSGRINLSNVGDYSGMDDLPWSGDAHRIHKKVAWNGTGNDATFHVATEVDANGPNYGAIHGGVWSSVTARGGPTGIFAMLASAHRRHTGAAYAMHAETWDRNSTPGLLVCYNAEAAQVPSLTVAGSTYIGYNYGIGDTATNAIGMQFQSNPGAVSNNYSSGIKFDKFKGTSAFDFAVSGTSATYFLKTLSSNAMVSPTAVGAIWGRIKINVDGVDLYIPVHHAA